MPESSIDAIILISTSWQALKRAEEGDERTMLCNCTVVLVFACFYIEANLNKIIDSLGKTKDMTNFLGKYPGLNNKIVWFYNEFVARDKAKRTKELQSKKIYQKTYRKFNGFKKLCDFRNNISHGVIVRKVANYEDAELLRNKAKEIVDNLYAIVKSKTGVEIQRNITYDMAIFGLPSGIKFIPISQESS